MLAYVRAPTIVRAHPMAMECFLPRKSAVAPVGISSINTQNMNHDCSIIILVNVMPPQSMKNGISTALTKDRLEKKLKTYIFQIFDLNVAAIGKLFNPL